MQLFAETLWVQRELMVGQSPCADGTRSPVDIHGNQHLSCDDHEIDLFQVLSMRRPTHLSPQFWEMGLMLVGTEAPRPGHFLQVTVKQDLKPPSLAQEPSGLSGKLRVLPPPRLPLIAFFLPLLMHRILTCRVSALQALST